MERPRDLTIQVDDDTQLRLVREEDAEELLALILSDREHLRTFMDWVDEVHNVEYELAFINARLEEYDRGAGLQFNVVHRGRIVGATGTVVLDRANEVAEVGYFITSTHQGRGLMTRAVGAFIDHLFRTEGMHRVYARLITTNQREARPPLRGGPPGGVQAPGPAPRRGGPLDAQARVGGAWWVGGRHRRPGQRSNCIDGPKNYFYAYPPVLAGVRCCIVPQGPQDRQGPSRPHWW